VTFRNPILGAGGSTLLRPAIQSPNFIHGVSGWSINRAGNAEFNDLVIRGTYMGQNYVISEDGLFFYSGTPAAGNMTGSWAPAAGVDGFGNAYPAGLEIYSTLGSILLSAVDGILQSVGSSGRQVTVADGSIQWSAPGSAGNGSLDIGATLREMDWQSGQLAVADRIARLAVVSSTGTPAAGNQDTSPRSSTTGGVGVPAYHYVSGAVVKSDGAGSTSEVWQVAGGNGAAFNTNWLASSTFNGSTGWPTVQYRKDAEDNLVVTGCFKTSASWTTGGSPFTLPTAFRPKQQWAVAVQKNVGGTLSTGMGQISAGGNLNLLSGSGVAPVASAEYLVTGVIPLGNIA
jgi:hypothetical protein